ncbi:MAG: LysR family transcriptional regulator [Gammaproteobacteria bacterium]|nr:LysR family transcriptional regulator [Gammaproteobacteria bacterium]
MDIQNIRAFLAVSETASFSRAAERLHLTQPAISKRIQSMEQFLDISLFDRIGKSVQLTEAGQALIPGYRRILDELEESERIISNLRQTTRGHLRFATSHHIGLHRLPAVLRQFAKAYPEVDLELQFMDSEQACQQVLHGDIELGIVTLPTQADERLSLQTVWHDPMHCVVAADHPLAANEKISRKQLLAQPSILPSTGTYTRALINRALQLDEQTSILMETNYLETIKAMVQTGIGWGVIPDSMLDDSLQVIEMKTIKMQRELGVVFHKARTRSSAANALLQLLSKDN